MKRKLFAVIIAAMLIVTMLPSMAFAKETRKLYKADGMTWELDDENVECKLVKVDECFDGTIPMDITTRDGKWYCTAPLLDEITWNNKHVRVLKIPALVGGANADAFKQAANVEFFKVYPVKDQESDLPLLESDKYGVLYEIEYDDCEEIARRLVAYPNGKTDRRTLRLMEGTTEINQFAFEYCRDLSKMKKLQVSDGKLYLDLMGAEEAGSISIDALAKNKCGKYDFANFTISLANPYYNEEEMEEDEEYFFNDDLFAYARMRGMKIDASIYGAKIFDVVYNSSNKYDPKVMYGSTLLVLGKDYEYEFHQKMKSVGLADIQLFGLGDFKNTSILTSYWVKPYKVKMNKPCVGKNCITVKWNADKSKYGKTSRGKAIHVSGYQVAYKKAGARRFTYKTVKGYKTSSLSIGKLKSNKKYTVKVRSYKNIDLQTVYSSWSDTRTVGTGK